MPLWITGSKTARITMCAKLHCYKVIPYCLSQRYYLIKYNFMIWTRNENSTFLFQYKYRVFLLFFIITNKSTINCVFVGYNNK